MKKINCAGSFKTLARILWPLLLAACATTVDKPTTALVHSAGAPILDFRQVEHRQGKVTVESLQANTVKQTVFGTGYPETLHVGEAVYGSFTAPGEHQQIYLLTRPERKNAMLAIFSEDAVNKSGNEDFASRLETQFVTDEPYHSLVAALDLNNDTLHDLMLVQYDFHMGVLIASVDILGLIEGQLRLLDTQEFVLQDSCESTLPERAIKASALWFDGEELLRRNYMASCVDADLGFEQRPAFSKIDN